MFLFLLEANSDVSDKTAPCCGKSFKMGKIMLIRSNYLFFFAFNFFHKIFKADSNTGKYLCFIFLCEEP